MARGVARTGSGRQVFNEQAQNGELPQSTAAHLVHQFTAGNQLFKSQDQETFRQLLEEVLGSRNDGISQEDMLEPDSATNYKLIYVIVKAGLDVLKTNDPFKRPTQLTLQASQSLTAIEYTIEKDPKVLFASPHIPEDDSKAGWPLFAWLLPKLLVLTVWSSDDAVNEASVQVLRKILTAQQKTHTEDERSYSIIRYVQGLVNDLLARLEDPTSHGPMIECQHQLDVPSTATITDAFLDAEQALVPRNIIRMSLSNIGQSIRITISLLSIIAPILSQRAFGKVTPAMSDPFWTLGSLTRLWLAIGPESSYFQQHGAHLSSISLFLDISRKCLKCLASSEVSPSILKRIVSLILHSSKQLLAPRLLHLNVLVEKSICLNLFQIASLSVESPLVRHLFKQSMSSIPEICSNDQERFSKFGQDLQTSLAMICQIWHKSVPLESWSNHPGQALVFKDLEIQKFFDASMLQNWPISPFDDGRPTKRIRLSLSKKNAEVINSREGLVVQIIKMLGLQSTSELADLSHTALDYYPNLTETEQCSLYTLMGQLACVSAQTTRSMLESSSSLPLQNKCSICDSESKESYMQESSVDKWTGTESDMVFAAFVKLLKLPKLQKHRRPRVAAMLALKCFLSHTANEENFDLKTSLVGQWCLQALRSSIRELRVAAGRTIPAFMQKFLPDSMLVANRSMVLDVLRSISEQSDLALQETCILAWGQLARVARGDAVNLMLFKLVEYLGHTNALLSGLAYDELQRMSNHSPYSAMKIFAPYWRTIAVIVVQDLQRNPQTAQQLSDLMGMGVADFLSLTQVYTVPFFVLTKRQEILQRIADACGQSIMSLCRDHNNLAAILSYVLLRSSVDAENMVISLLHAVSPEFSNVDCAELLKSEPQATAAELLKAAGEDDEVQRLRAHQALHFLASVTNPKLTSGRSSARKVDSVGPFFETHILGIMTLLADTINDGKGPQPTTEKVRCLGAIREMIKLAKGHISNGLPQICSCLRSAIENEDLADQGLDAWMVMISNLGEDEIASLLDTTFAMLVRHWKSFTSDSQQKAYDMISDLLKSHNAMICDIVHTLPSLASVPLMTKFEEEFKLLKARTDVKQQFTAFSQRCQNENSTVVLAALTELVAYLSTHQGFMQDAAISEQPDPVVGQLTRTLLNTSVSFSAKHPVVSKLCGHCLGLVGCLDPTRIDAVWEKKEILVLSNFVRDDETNDFIIFFLREVLVKAFLSATNSRSQGFLAYAMQELLNISGIKHSIHPRSRDDTHDANYRRWFSLPESVRATLMPFTDSKYFVTAGIPQPPARYPLYDGVINHTQWLRSLTYDLLRKDIGPGRIKTVFSVLTRIVRFQDLSISSFLLPFACLNVIISGHEHEKHEVGRELLLTLLTPLPDLASRRDNIILCSQTVFQVLDYLSRWMQEKKKDVSQIRSSGTRSGRSLTEAELQSEVLQINKVESILSIIPADVISRRAVECKSYSRALFHWEQYIRQQRVRYELDKQDGDLEPLYERLQEVYTQIDEPDGIEGISAHLQVLNIDQQILEHRKAGRWTAAQSWYELLLAERPDDLEVQYDLLTSLKESGQHDVLLNQVDAFRPLDASRVLSTPLAVEASWVTGKWNRLRKYLQLDGDSLEGDFNMGVGTALIALSEGKLEKFASTIDGLRETTARTLSVTNTTSLQGCHDLLLRFHILVEIEMLSGISTMTSAETVVLMATMDRRLSVLGPFLSDKQYILGLRRAAMQLSRHGFSNIDVASAWLTSARLARKSKYTHQAFNAVLHASQLGDDSATIEHSRLLWTEGSHRKAIQSLEGAIAANAFRSHDYTENNESLVTNNQTKQQQQNILKARAHLLLAKWIDRAGQTQSDVIISQYKKAVDCHNRWEKGHYYLGKHYNKLLESEKAKLPAKQAQNFINGETAKLVIENYLRSLAFGAKYIYQTLPKLLTLWLDLGSDCEYPLDPKYGSDETFRAHIVAQRRKMLGACNAQVKKYIDRLPAFVFYTALSQIVARICHQNQSVYALLVEVVAKVVGSHAPQALWTLLALIKSSNTQRQSRGAACMTRVQEAAKKARNDSAGAEVRVLITQGQKLSSQLLHVCEGEIHGKPSKISLAKDLNFNHKTASSRLAIPLEMALTASLPTISDGHNMKSHKAFAMKDYVYISTFLDEALVLNSLQRPRKISVRGSDGRIYALLCKPKDDLRKDQRLMEFNAMINRALKKDADSSKRRLYIKTYAVTPLNEECGLIEWIDKLKTLREILLASYKQKNVTINYSEIRSLLEESISDPGKLPVFTHRIIPHFSPVFHEWFVEMFPEPSAWFTARLRYTRSCAVMSIVGHVLGLGDRHGENILFEEGNGGTFHVDFNCLFDKGLTFEKPELVPFRLTHNMVDAFGAYGYEGPFRKSCELTLGILRQNEDTLMTILETFLYDPTTDFIGKKKKKESVIPDTPEGVLDSVRNKVRGLLPMESVPLSVEGYVQALIQQATDPFKLASMYIGWCAFF